LALLTYDPIAAMAGADKAAMDALLASVHTDSHLVASLLERIAGEAAWQVLNDSTEVVEVPAQIDKAAELQAKWGTAPGQAWQIGPHKLVCGDSRQKAVAGRLWRDGGPKIRLVWTDPPYGIDYAAKNAYLNRTDRGNRIQTPIENDNLTAGETGFMFKQALEVARQFAEPGAACYATVPAARCLCISSRRSTHRAFHSMRNSFGQNLSSSSGWRIIITVSNRFCMAGSLMAPITSSMIGRKTTSSR
jgi:hypothetical protein